MPLVYFFGEGKADGNASMKTELGGKGANLAEMTKLGLPVPPGFTISTSVCMDFLAKGGSFPPALKAEVQAAMRQLEQSLGSRFAGDSNPLLVSVRSGARASMPGMMDTILNLGLNDVTVEALATRTGNKRFAYDSYRRFIQMYANVVKDLDHHHMDEELEAAKRKKGVKEDVELDATDLKQLCTRLKAVYLESAGEAFPQDPEAQLWSAIEAVFRSWNSSRAVKYREINSIPNDWGTAVNVCSMVYGNMGPTSGTGVCFTRDPSTGENVFYGEYLLNAQGEDVVAGIRTPIPLTQLGAALPDAFRQLEDVRAKLERHYRDVQDIEFTIQEGRLFLLQTRNAKRTVKASLKIAIDFVREGILSEGEALQRVNAGDLEKLLHPTLDPDAKKQVIARGLPASPGAVSGRVVFTAADAESWAARGEDVVLVRDETSPEDIGGMHASQGFLTARGGMTSHAAVVARQMGKCCVAGCSALQINAHRKTVRAGTLELNEGDWITLEGSTGEVMYGKVPTRPVELSEDFALFLGWAAAAKRLGVRANADTPRDAKLARDFGAKGIGLCRTEHMFFDEERLPVVRSMILARTAAERQEALKRLLPFQKEDFKGILSEMAGLPVTIRLLDPPLHEFLPQLEKDMMVLAAQLGLPLDDLKGRVKGLHEANPMLGHRGCRLGISHPEIYEMQVQAIAEATAELRAGGTDAQPEIMIPLVGHYEELRWLRQRLEGKAKAFYEAAGKGGGAGTKALPPFDIPFGTMIEVPRAAVTAAEIAKVADFFSFGTNDLTQTTFGFSRDDSAPFLRHYKQEGILPEDPFAVLDQEGVGQLVKWSCTQGRSTNPKLKLGICGEHGGDPRSVQFFHDAGLDYVSCSPFRVPVAILAAGQAGAKDKQK